MMRNGAKAISKYLRISPQKARLAAALIRNLPVEVAEAELRFSNLKGGRLLIKTLRSAVANAVMQQDVSKEELKVVEVRVDEGPDYKRSKPKNKGGSHPYRVRLSHFTVIVNVE
jgi:large subunit ribosomal protein L22